jgi:hypothetical protein
VNSTDRINACAKLGDILRNPDSAKYHSVRKEIEQLNVLIESSHNYNGWFTPDNVKFAIHALGKSLEPHKVEKWLNRYPEEIFDQEHNRTIGVVMAGNIPIVGFHDYLCVMITGNKLIAKLSSDDNKILPLIHKIFGKIEPGFQDKAVFTEEKMTGFNAIIATGSNNTSRYFEYYFGKYPNIIRKNRNGVAVLTGTETQEELAALGEDIFRYYGLGCRNVSKLFVPENYRFDKFFEAIEPFAQLAENHKYKNNYDYNKSIYLVNNTAHFDNGFLILKEDAAFASPVAVVHFEYYNQMNDLQNELALHKNLIQCIISIDGQIPDALKPGKSQHPQLWNYADNRDTIRFLMELS